VNGVETALLFAHVLLFCVGFLAASTLVILTADDTIGAPVSVTVLVAILCWGVAKVSERSNVENISDPTCSCCLVACLPACPICKVFVDQFDTALHTILLNFAEDCERNIRSAQVFMPPEFRQFIDDYGYYKHGKFPSDPSAMYVKLFSKLLGLMAVPTKEVVLEYSVTQRATMLNHDKKNPSIFKTWSLKCGKPVSHASQPRNTQELFVNRYGKPYPRYPCSGRTRHSALLRPGRSIMDNLTTLSNIPKLAWSLGDGKRFAWELIQWGQWRLPLSPAGPIKLNPMKPREVESRVEDAATPTDDPSSIFCSPADRDWPLIQSGEVEVYEFKNEEGMHDHMTPQVS
jgi:hypothetical protein